MICPALQNKCGCMHGTISWPCIWCTFSWFCSSQSNLHQMGMRLQLYHTYTHIYFAKQGKPHELLCEEQNQENVQPDGHDIVPCIHPHLFCKAGQTTCWFTIMAHQKKLSSEEPKTAKESCFGLKSCHFLASSSHSITSIYIHIKIHWCAFSRARDLHTSFN